MSKANINKANKRQAAKSARSDAARKAAERRTVENKARKMLRTLRNSGGADHGTATALADLIRRHPWLRNIQV